MPSKARQMKGSLQRLMKDLTKDDPAVRELLETSIQETVRSLISGKDHKWVARQVEKKCDLVFDHRDRY